MNAPIRVGISGAVRGGPLLAGLRPLGERVRLAAVYDPDPAARDAFAAEKSGVGHVCTSYEQLLEHCDLVVVSSPQQHHVPQAVMALDAGVHVLSEVPAAVSLEQAQELVAAARGSNAIYGMAENYCYTRPNLIVREMVRAGVLGDIYFGVGEYLHDMKSWHTTADGRRTWRHYWQVGRDGHTYPTHSLGPLLQWTGDRVVAVSCHGSGRHTDPEHILQDTTITLMRTAAGRLFTIRFDLLSNRPHLMEYYAVQGTKGAYEASRRQGEGGLVYVVGESPKGEWEPIEKYAGRFLPAKYARPQADAGHWGSDTWPIHDFVEYVEKGERPEIDVYTALDFSLPAMAAESSIAQQGAWVHVPDPRYFTAGIGVEPGSESPLA